MCPPAARPPFTHDANGNMLTGLGGKIMTYDGESRPLSVTHLGKRTCYVYGVDGKRLKKVEGLPPTQDCTALPTNVNATVYFGAVEIRNWKVAGQEQVLTYPHPAIKLLNGVTPAAATYLHRDGLSSVRAITSAAGAKIEAALYKPFGEQSEWVLPGNAAPETKGWIGERYDADAGLQYLNARYYDPELSLFLQPDWFEVTKAGVGTNRFSYSFSDPVNKFDPGGNNSNVISGSEGDDDHNVPDHFLKNGLERAKKLKDKDKDTTWYIHAGQSGSEFSDLIGDYKRRAEEYGIIVKVFNTKDELMDGLTGNKANPIDNLTYVGHGFAGFLGVDARLQPGSGGRYDVGIMLRGSDFAAMNFSSMARVNLFATCNAATASSKEISVVEQFSRILSPSASVGGYAAQVNFFDAEVDTDRQLGMRVENPWYWSAYRAEAIKPFVDMNGLYKGDN